MEEALRESCRVVYYCPHGAPDASRLFHPANLPAHSMDTRFGKPGLLSQQYVDDHVHMLLNEDLGGFEQVFVSPRRDECLDQMSSWANVCPTVVLVESRSDLREGEPNESLAFLESLTAKVRGALSPFPQTVMAFVLSPTSVTPATMYHDPAALLDPTLVQFYRAAGALETLSSPLDFVGLDRLVGRVKECTRAPAQRLGLGMTRRLWQSIDDQSQPPLASHRPDERISPERRTTIEKAIRTWRFPAHDLDMDELTYGALFMLEHVLRNPELEAYRLPRAELMSFLLATRRQYGHEREVHYHNWRHAVDVTQSLYCFLCDLHLCPLLEDDERRTIDKRVLEQLLTPADALTLLISGIGHDVGHPGVNNAFLVACNHSLAHLYNDKSVLENYHCATYTQVCRRYWPALSTVPHFRNNLISIILATDMQRHFEYMTQLEELTRKVERCEARIQEWSEKEKDQARDLLMSLLIKAADISNVARPFDISAQWAKILMNEFARQGELELELRMPTCLFGGPPDREDDLAAAQSQKGFMNLFGFPLFQGIATVIPSVSCTMLGLEYNKSVWESKIDMERSRREAVGDGRQSPRTYGLPKDDVEQARRHKRESEPQTAPLEASHPLTTPARRQLELKPLAGETLSDGESPKQKPQAGTAGPVDNRRTSAPLLGHSLTIIDGCSRRSSKDVALNQLHELNLMAQQALRPDSRRTSVDAGWQIHPGRPGSRRASKDESLTTIIVASQGSPSSRASPAPSSPSLRANNGIKASVLGGGTGSTKRHHPAHGPIRQPVSPNVSPIVTSLTPRSHTPPRSQTLSSAADTPVTQISSLALSDDDVPSWDASQGRLPSAVNDILQSPIDSLTSPGQGGGDTADQTVQRDPSAKPDLAVPDTSLTKSPLDLSSFSTHPSSPSAQPHAPLVPINIDLPRRTSNLPHAHEPQQLSAPSLMLSPTKSNTTTTPSDVDARCSSSSSPRLLATSQTTPTSEEDSDGNAPAASRPHRPHESLASSATTQQFSPPRRASQPHAHSPDDIRGSNGVRESRSRSRLRGLKFWRKRREAPGAAVAGDNSTLPSASARSEGDLSP